MIGLIWAESQNRVIGTDGQIPWHLPEDLAHFKEVTNGAVVIMGRLTWESLPAKARPLPGRRNIVVTSKISFHAPGAALATSVNEAISLAAVLDPGADIWVIGGHRMYEATIDRADRLEITQLRSYFDGDTFAPAIPYWFQPLFTSAWKPGPTPELDHRFISFAPAAGYPDKDPSSPANRVGYLHGQRAER